MKKFTVLWKTVMMFIIFICLYNKAFYFYSIEMWISFFQIFYFLIFFHGVKKEEFDARWKNFQSVKIALANSLVKNKKHIRALLIERIVLQHESRIIKGTSSNYTPTHKRIQDELLLLATSQYSEVITSVIVTLIQLKKQTTSTSSKFTISLYCMR